MKLYFLGNTPTKFHDHPSTDNYFFTIEKDKWTFTDSLEEADVVPVSLLQYCNDPSILDSLSEDQIALVWILETCGDHVTPKYCRDITQNIDCLKKHKKTIFVHTNQLDTSDPQYISNDIMFNRQKLYFTEYDKEMCFQKQWVNELSNHVYTLSNIEKRYSVNSKTFLSPNRIKKSELVNGYDEWNFQYVKLKLHNFLRDINANMYISDPENGVILETNGWKENPKFKQLDFKNGSFFAPVADFYYNTSYVSVCIETLFVSSNEIFYPSEKYFNHLIKGNFPLIFSGAGVIKNLKKYYNFKFPDWIDYSYDDIENENDRFQAYLKSIEKISSMSTLKIHKLYLRDKHILEHNRNVFFNKPYDSLHDRIKSSIEQLGWDKQ